MWKPPVSPIGMLQEQVWPDVWKMLVVCILHNQTSRKQVDKVFQELFEKYPNPSLMSKASQNDLSKMLRPLGLYNRRAKSLIRFSSEFISKQWSRPKELYACGKYANDCYEVFCLGNWKDIKPEDHALNDYVEWLFREEKNNARRA